MYRFNPNRQNNTIYVVLRDLASGLPRSDQTASSGGAQAYYVREQQAPVNIPLTALVTPEDAWTPGGFLAVSSSDAPGLYRLDLPNAVMVAGAAFALVNVLTNAVIPETALIRIEYIAQVGQGASTFTATITNVNTGNPLPGVSVWVSTDQAGTNVVAGSLPTNAQGQVTFYLNPGTYYMWVEAAGYTDSNPTTITVT